MSWYGLSRGALAVAVSPDEQAAVISACVSQISGAQLRKGPFVERLCVTLGGVFDD